MKKDPTLPAALLDGAAINRERIERLHELSPGSGMAYAHTPGPHGAPCLTLPCARCTNGRRERYADAAPTRRERCDVCSGTGRLLTYTGEAVLSAIALVLAPQLAPEATDEAIAAFNDQAAKEYKATLAREDAARKARADQIRAAAEQLARDPSLFERIQGLLGGEAARPGGSASEEQMSDRLRSEFSLEHRLANRAEQHSVAPVRK